MKNLSCATQSFKRIKTRLCGRFLWALLRGRNWCSSARWGHRQVACSGFCCVAPTRSATSVHDFHSEELFPAATLSEYAVTKSKACSGESPGTILADVRTWEEYTGKCDQYEYHVGLGRILNARWATGVQTRTAALTICSPMATCVILTRCWRSGEQVSPSCAGPGRRIVFCGSGWRSAYATVLSQCWAWNVSSYDGGFGWNRFMGIRRSWYW